MAAKKKRKARKTRRQVARLDGAAIRNDLQRFLAVHNNDIANVNSYLTRLDREFQQHAVANSSVRGTVLSLSGTVERLATALEAIERPSVISRRLLEMKSAEHVTQDIHGRLNQVEINLRELRKDLDALRMHIHQAEDTEALRKLAQDGAGR